MIASGTHSNFGSWISPITSEIIASKSLSFTDIHIDNGIIYWVESRPNEKGRSVVVSYHQNATYQDETPEEYSVGTSVHGYGGGAFFVRDQQLYFSNSKDGIVYHKNLKTNVIKPITEYFEGRFADFHADPKHEYLYCIRKDDSKKSQFPPTEIVQISLQTKKITVLFTGSDFYSSPSVSPNGTKISWLQWDHPNMPWDATELWIADVNLQGVVSNKKRVSIDSQQSFYQPVWNSKNELFVSSDITGFWNIYKVTNFKLENIFTRDADFGRPMWISGTRCFDFINESKIISSFCEKGIWKTGLIDIYEKSFHEINNSLTCIYNIAAKNNCVAFFGGSETLPLAVLFSNYESIQKTKVLRNSIGNIFQQDFISMPELIEFPTRDNQIAYAFYYKPKNPNYSYKEDQLPPLIVKVHGGPTANADFMFNPKVQYYTSRGFAYIEVNYRGSTGYGRNYREQLKGQWGIRDVEDCIDAALYLCNKNKVDKNHLIIAGSSSGGLTVLSSLAFHNIYKCGSCTYGIADLIAMTEHIHKFEAYYDQGLIGGSVEKEREKYFNRSPLNFARNIKSPIIFFHGDKDMVVHVSQTYKIVDELNKNKIFNEVYIFEGEGHGFKKAESIITSLDKELDFFKKID